MFAHLSVVRLIGLCGLLMLCGCSAPGALETAPRVSLINLQTVQIQLLEQRYLATVRIQNPNAVDMPVRGLDYTITINGSEFAAGVSNQRFTIPAYGEKTVDLGVTSTIIKLLDQLRLFSETRGTVTYAISGTLAIEGQSERISFERDGEIDLRLERAPQGRAA